MKAKGDEVTDVGETVPAPSSVMVTAEALPANVFPVIVTGVMPHEVPVLLVSVTAGLLTQPHDTEKESPIVMQPAPLLTVIL